MIIALLHFLHFCTRQILIKTHFSYFYHFFIKISSLTPITSVHFIFQLQCSLGFVKLTCSQLSLNIIKSLHVKILQSYIFFCFMGAQCVPCSPKVSSRSYHQMSSESSRIRASDQMLHFEIIISDLEIHSTANNVGKVVFMVQNYVKIQFTSQQFFLMDKMIRCTALKKASFSVYSKNIEFLEFNVTILDTKGSRIEKVSLKMHAVCEGPKHHDHLLKQMKSRIIYNLEVSQLVSAIFGCEDFKIFDSKRKDLTNEYCLSLDMLMSGNQQNQSDEKKVYFSGNPQQSQKYTKNDIPSKKLKQSLLRINIFKLNSSGFQSNLPTYLLCLPFMKFWSQDDMSVVSQKNGDRTLEKINFKHSDKFKNQIDQEVNIFLDLTLKFTKIYLEQIDCMIFSEAGLKTISPHLISSKGQNTPDNSLCVRQIQVYEKIFKNHKKVTYQTKNEIQKIIKECYNCLSERGDKIANENDVENVQHSLLNILNCVCQLITQGEDVTNQSIWLLIDKIIHRPELTARYFYVIRTPSQKTEIGLKFYKFIFGMLSKIIMCTTMGLTYHELKCIQKFIGYAYFRCKWVQNLVINALKRSDDPQFSLEKLMEIGVYYSNRSPSKSMLYQWEQCLLPFIKDEPRYREISHNLQETSESVPKWAQMLFNRDDQDLYYGLLIQIWTQGEIYLDNQGKTMWQYFPYYDQLLRTFLGEMNRNQIVDYSNLFRYCSIKLISNEKLLNNFVMFLFPKTCLYETNCVMKCLELIHSYFQVISKKNKKMPNEFNFSYFYTGIKCIFQSNHSYLLTRVIGLLYQFYPIFTKQFKKSLDNFIFSKGFNEIFLHWCDYVRKMFYLLLEYRIVRKFKQYQGQYQNKQIDKNSTSFQIIEKMHKYQNMLGCIEQEQLEQLKKKKVQFLTRDAYFIRMKQKLVRKNANKIQTPSRLARHKSGQFYLQIQPSNMRKQTQWQIKEYNYPKSPRKWSANCEEEQINFIPQNLKKYIIAGMKQFREIKKIKNPDEEVRKIMKIFQGKKSIDN